MSAARHRGVEAPFACDEPRADGRQPTAQIERFELTPQLADAARAHREARASDGRERVSRFRHVTPAQRQAACISGERRPAAHDMDAPAEALDTAARGGAEPIAQPIDPRTEIVLARDDDFSRC